MLNRKLAAPVVALGTLLVVSTGCDSGGSSTAATTPSVTVASNATPTSAQGSSTGADDFCQHATGINPAALLGASQDDDAQMKSDLESAVSDAPSEIKSDFQTVVDIEGPILDGSVDQAQIQQALSDPSFSTALEHIATWASTHCS